MTMTIASPETPRTGTELVELDRKHLIHPSLHGSITERHVMVRGRGTTLWDADGTEYLDGTGGLWLVQIGHGREEIAAAHPHELDRDDEQARRAEVVEEAEAAVTVARDLHAEVSVAFDERHDRVGQLLLDHATHGEDLVADAFQVLVEAA